MIPSQECAGADFPRSVAIAKQTVRRFILRWISHLPVIWAQMDLQLALSCARAGRDCGGHSHTKLPAAHEENGVLLVQTQEYANYLGFLRLEVDGEIVEYESRLLPVTAFGGKQLGYSKSLTIGMNSSRSA